MRRPIGGAPSLPQQVHEEGRVQVCQSLGARARERRREAMRESVASSVDASSATPSRAARRVAPVDPVPKRSFMTSENDWLGRFLRRRASYASRSMVMVLTAMWGKCTYGTLMSTMSVPELLWAV